MARTKQTARKSYGGVAPMQSELPDRSTLLQSMGFPARGSFAGGAAQVPDWSLVISRLSSHPEEAAVKDPFSYDYIGYGLLDKEYPLSLALANVHTPVTRDVAEAFIKAFPDIATSPRSQVLDHAYENPNIRDEVIEVLLQHNPYLKRDRTALFQLMGFPRSRDPRSQEDFPPPSYNLPTTTVDWDAFASRLKEHPEEASIVCPARKRLDGIIVPYFPLEAALQFFYTPVPIRVVETLLNLCPTAVTSPDSQALLIACSNPFTDAAVVKAILSINPSLASKDYCSVTGDLDFSSWREGLPLHFAVRMKCALQVLPLLIDLYPQALSRRYYNNCGIPLQIASVGSVSSPVVKLLLEQGQRHNVGGPRGAGGLFVRDDDDECALDQLISFATHAATDFDRQAWEKLCLSLQAAGAAKTGQGSNTMWDYPVLHAAIEFGKEGRVVEKALSENPGDLLRVDSLGRTPLIVAIEMAGNIPDDYDYHDREIIHFDAVMRMLLDDQNGGSRKAAGIPLNKGGELPLHLALQHGLGLPEGLNYIVNAEPRALETPDPETHLLPFMMAAIGERARVQTIFYLIMEAPHLLTARIDKMRVA